MLCVATWSRWGRPADDTSTDGAYILTWANDDTTRLWSTAGQLIATFAGVAPVVRSGVLSPDGQYLLTARLKTGQVHVWRLPAGVRFFGDRADASSGKTAATNKLQVAAELDRGRAEIGEPLATLAIPEPKKFWIGDQPPVFSPDARRILTVMGKTAYLCDTDGNLVAVLGHAADFAMFSPDGLRVLTASEGGWVDLWSMDGDLIKSFSVTPLRDDELFSVAFSPNGACILTTRTTAADLWDHQGSHLARLRCETYRVKQGLFSYDGQRIVTIGEYVNPDVRLWDGDGQLIASLCDEDTYGEGPWGVIP